MSCNMPKKDRVGRSDYFIFLPKDGKIRGKICFSQTIFKKVKWSCFLREWDKFNQNIVFSHKNTKHCSPKLFLQCFPGVFKFKNKYRVGEHL